MNEPTRIPFLDLISLHRELKDELTAVFEKALDSAGFIGGAMVNQFELDFADYCDTEYCVGVGSGTDALRFALIAAGIQPGDAVVTTPNTFAATTEAISQAGARPVFVDVDERTYNLDPDKLRQYLEFECELDGTGRRLVDRKTKRPVTAVIPVHLYGQTADMDPILELAERFQLTVIEDACQAHGAEYYSTRKSQWQKAGSIGKAAAFSFYPGKNLGACGEAGAVTTNDGDLAQQIRMLRDHGQCRKYYHDIEGYNGRLDAVQAGILSVKLKHLPRWTEMRRAAAVNYRELFSGSNSEITMPFEPSWSRAVYHLFVVRSDSRDDLMSHLTLAGIGTGIHYPIPLHLQRPYHHLGYVRGDLPVAEGVADKIVSLPMFPQLTRNDQERVVSAIQEFVTTGSLAALGKSD